MTEDVHELTTLEIKDSLSQLGRHPLTQRHAYLQAMLSDKKLSSIDALKNFPLLMYVNLSKNEIQDLESLGNMSCLVQLDVSNNQLESCLDFAPLLCTVENSWSTGHEAIGSMLTLADLSFNRITAVNDLKHHPYLECLILNNNSISNITGISSLRFLKVLDVSNNQIAIISGLDNLPIQELNLSNNKITTLQGLSKLPLLSVLNIAYNSVSSLGCLATCKSLTSLNCSYNKLKHIRQTEFLGDFDWLKSLSLLGNEVCYKKCYRLRVVFRLLRLFELDNVLVSAQEKIRALNLYNAEGGDLRAREQVFYKHYRDEDTFENYCDTFQDDEFGLSAQDLYDGVGR